MNISTHINQQFGYIGIFVIEYDMLIQHITILSMLANVCSNTTPYVHICRNDMELTMNPSMATHGDLTLPKHASFIDILSNLLQFYPWHLGDWEVNKQ